MPLMQTPGIHNATILQTLQILITFPSLSCHSSMNFFLCFLLLRYVRFIEGEIHDALSLHQRGEDGHYSRRVSSAKHLVKDVFIPPHFYGQLSQLPDGLKLLHQDARVHSLLKVSTVIFFLRKCVVSFSLRVTLLFFSHLLCS